MNKDKGSASQYRIELVLALVTSILLTIVYQRDVLFASNDLYPSAYDFLGHMAKIEYIADSFRVGVLPSWYPHWYSGSTVIQYYPPFSYLCLVPVYMISGSAMVTFKFFSFSVVLIGALGVWRLCRLYIGNWCGLVGILVFCSSPFIQQIVIELGQVAQGPVIALTPWYIMSLLDVIATSSKKSWCISTWLCSLMILSHANSAFMLCFSLMLAFAMLIVNRRVSLAGYSLATISIIFAGAMTAFWSLVGVTSLENPEIPYLAEEAVALHTATAEWFYNSAHQYYFSIVALVGGFYAVIVYARRRIRSISSEKEDFFAHFILLLFLITIVFSFGENVILFKYIPMHKSIVAGRILAITVFPTAVLWAYLAYQHYAPLDSSMVIRVCKQCVYIVFVVLLIMDTNPFHFDRTFWGQTLYDTTRINSNLSPVDYNIYFQKGRGAFLGAYDGGMSYFPVKQGYALSDGYNIEGTPHFHDIRNQAIANAAKAFDYFAKNLAFHNVRYLIIHPVYQEVREHLTNFQEIEGDLTEGHAVEYVNKLPSTYVLLDKRNALLIGPGSEGISMEFPYLVHEDRDHIYDYSMDELSRYRLIYINEPDLSTVSKKHKTEEMIKELVKRGTVVFVSPHPAIAQRYNLFGVVPQYYGTVRTGFLYHAEAIPFDEERESEKISVDGAYFKGLDESYYILQCEEAPTKEIVIGAKNIEGGEVIFIGMNLSHHLKSVSVTNWGSEKMNTIFADETYEKKHLFEDLFEKYGVEKDFYPEGFAIQGFQWDHRTVQFDYVSEKPENVTVSITYAPRWKAYLNGERIHVGQRENLVTLNLPSGKNAVELVYGITKYGIAGYAVSAISLLSFFQFFLFYDKMSYWIGKVIARIKNMLQIA